MALSAELDEVCAFQRGFREEDTVVRDDANGVAVDLCEPRDERRPVVGLELGEHGAVYQAGDDFVDGDLPAEIRAHDAGEVFGVVQRFREGGSRGRGERLAAVPIQIRDAAAGEDEGMRVVDGEVVRHTRDFAVETTAAEVLC